MENLANGVSTLGEGDESYQLYVLDQEHALLSCKGVTEITVVQYYDFNKQIIHSFTSIPNVDFLHFKGNYNILE